MIHISFDEPIVDSSTAPGAVVVSVRLDAPAAEAWQALTEPVVVARWFGTLTEALRPGTNARLDFGDGDFFDLEVIQLDPPCLLQYVWRFLGIGPLSTITWQIVPRDAGCLVTVIDSEPERSPETTLELKEGWLDFTGRLEGFISTGVPTRYDWRREFEGSIEVPGNLEHTWSTLFVPHMLSRWLPFAGAPLKAGTYFTVPDDAEPSVLEIADVIWSPPTHVRFHVTHPTWRQPTRCELKLARRRQNTLISVSHAGWEAISPDGDEQLQQRKRFAKRWITSLFWCSRSLLARYCSQAMEVG